MNIPGQKKLILLGIMGYYPVAGVTWQTVHYLLGFKRLGYDVYYVEAHGRTPGVFMQQESDDGPGRAAAHIASVLHRFDLGDRWAYHAIHPESRFLGMTELQLKELYSSAELIINLHGSHVPTAELGATNRLVYVESDPVEVEIELHAKKQDTIDYLKPHCAFFTYGENIGQPDCLVPPPELFKFQPTRQPVIMDLWKNHGNGAGACFTTIGNWRQPGRIVKLKGKSYSWSKHLEFQKFIDLPARAGQPFELAMSQSSYNADDQRLLEANGWQIRDALAFSYDLDAYRQYIAQSRGEFTVAKEQNIQMRSGWFSDRSITYLAAGRPVITQQTGFSNIIPTGEGLFAFSTMDEILAAVDAINTDYARHSRAASAIARDYFSYDVVLTRLLADIGISNNPLSNLKSRISNSDGATEDRAESELSNPKSQISGPEKQLSQISNLKSEIPIPEQPPESQLSTLHSPLSTSEGPSHG